MTPVFPHYFLLLASIANIAKQISLSCYLATGVRFPILDFPCDLVCFAFGNECFHVCSQLYIEALL